MHYEIIRKAHENGHFGAQKIMKALQKEYYIPKLKEKAENFVECCIPYILSEKKRGKKESESKPILKGGAPLSTYHLIII